MQFNQSKWRNGSFEQAGQETQISGEGGFKTMLG